MVSEQKKHYMHLYNRKPEIKAKKAEYMRQKRAEADAEAAHKLVQNLIRLGYENLAYEYALERAPEMLVTAKTSAKRKK